MDRVGAASRIDDMEDPPSSVDRVERQTGSDTPMEMSNKMEENCSVHEIDVTILYCRISILGSIIL